jgi:hypothetical protein
VRLPSRSLLLLLAAISSGGRLSWARLANPVPAVRKTVRVIGRQLLVDGQPTHLKGVCWNPVRRGGVHPQDLDFRGFVATDAALMAAAGVNAIRTYEAITDPEVLDVLLEKGIYVLNTVYAWGGSPIHSGVDKVKKVQDHPAILMWVVGNEWNYNGLYAGEPFAETLAKVRNIVGLIKAQDPSRPVATVHGEMPSPDTLGKLGAVDIWGINKYSGLTFGDLFDAWAKVSTKPMFLGEYGADAYNTRTHQRDEEAQARATTALTQEINRASSAGPQGGVCIGGLIFELADEWWKDGTGNPSKHDVGGVSPGGGPYPDMTFNEEWWGLVNYDGRPREAFRSYARLPVPGQPLSASRENAEVVVSRLKACGAHEACKGELGNCCPGDDGAFRPCCTTPATTSARPSEAAPLPLTTWRPPGADGNG